MRILIISDHADPLALPGTKETGGQNTFIYYLSQHLASIGNSVDIYTRLSNKQKKSVINIGKNVRVIRIKAGPKKYIPRDQFIKVLPEFTKNIKSFIEKESLTYDIIHSNHWYSGLCGLDLAKAYKIPHVFTFHAIGQIRLQKFKEFKMQFADTKSFKKRHESETKIAKNVTRIIATSPNEKEEIIKIFKVKPEKISVITIGADTKVFKPISVPRAKKITNLNHQNNIVLFVGRLEWRKGIGTLIRAFKTVVEKYPNTKLVVIGGGRFAKDIKLDQAEKSRLVGLAQKLKVEQNIKFLGPKSQKMLPLFYNSADVTVVPSYYEFFGIVPLESMACGTPVVASNTGGLKFTTIDKKTGYLATPRDANDFANKIMLVIKKGREYYKAQCLKQIKENFEWKNIALEYKNLFEKLIKNNIPLILIGFMLA